MTCGVWWLIMWGFSLHDGKRPNDALHFASGHCTVSVVWYIHHFLSILKVTFYLCRARGCGVVESPNGKKHAPIKNQIFHMKIHSKILSIFLTSQINAYWLTARWPILVCIMLWTLRWASFPNFAQEDWRLDRLRSYYCIQLLHHLAFQSSGTPQVMPFGVLLLRVVRRVSDLQNPFFPPSKIIFGDFKIQIKFL